MRWKPVPSNPIYEVSDEGTVRAFNTSRDLFTRVDTPRPITVYTKAFSPQVRIGRDMCTLARVVCDAWLGECPDGYYYLHKDGDVKNCRLDNMRYAPQSDRKGKKGRQWKVRPILRIDRHGNVTGRYMSMEEAGRKNYISSSGIKYHVSGKAVGPTRDGIDFVYEDEWKEQTHA